MIVNVVDANSDAIQQNSRPRESSPSLGQERIGKDNLRIVQKPFERSKLRDADLSASKHSSSVVRKSFVRERKSASVA